MKEGVFSLSIRVCTAGVAVTKKRCNIVYEMTSQFNRAKPYSTTAVIKDQYPAGHTPGAAF